MFGMLKTSNKAGGKKYRRKLQRKGATSTNATLATVWFGRLVAAHELK